MMADFSRRTEVFIIRMWVEYMEQPTPTWRGEAQHVGSGEVIRFASLSEMESWIQGQVQSREGEKDAAQDR